MHTCKQILILKGVVIDTTCINTGFPKPPVHPFFSRERLVKIIYGKTSTVETGLYVIELFVIVDCALFFPVPAKSHKKQCIESYVILGYSSRFLGFDRDFIRVIRFSSSHSPLYAENSSHIRLRTQSGPETQRQRWRGAVRRGITASAEGRDFAPRFRPKLAELRCCGVPVRILCLISDCGDRGWFPFSAHGETL